MGVVLAGGEGRRLMPLTRDRAKPAVPFAGSYRLIDFALSNLANSGIRKMIVLTQYKSHSLDTHLAKTWRFSPLLGNYVTPVPAQQRAGKRWFEGSADAIWQNLNIIADEKPDIIAVFGADHIYRMDAEQMIDAHVESGAEVTVAGIRVPVDQANRFGVIETRDDGTRIAAFHEKPETAPGLPDDPGSVFASMGNYVFHARALTEAVSDDIRDEQSAHDMGGNVIARMVGAGQAAVYDFNSNDVPGATDRDRAYWRDVGTIDAFYEAHMDLISVNPVFNLYNASWPIYGGHDFQPPAKFVFDESGRRGVATDSMVDAGTIVSGATVNWSVIGPSCFLHSYSRVAGSVLMGHNEIHRNAEVRRAILDKNVVVPEGAKIGVDLDRDRQRYHVTDSGIVVIGKGERVHAD
jgi:glucose-1-phosphate adenylyltransferase